MSNYSKYKERSPQDTVFEIRRILNEIGLFPVLSWTERSYEGARSNRVTLFPSALGTNGKGTDELFATASGFAELMERLQNSFLMFRDYRDTFENETGFREFPDEKELPIWDILNDPDPFTKILLPMIGFKDAISGYSFMHMMCTLYGRDDDKLTVVPFADPTEGKIQWVPQMFVRLICGSNGMAAGNTLEEAMVQGLSEIFERRVNHLLIHGEAVPPVIPDEAIRHYSFYRLIEQARSEEGYEVTLYDCSLGKGYPVAGICMKDKETGTIGMRLGAHPSFAVAVERTLTEALQGQNLNVFTHSSIVGTEKQAKDFHNYTNVAKVGSGIYPMTMFSEEPGWEYKPWTRWEGLDNHGFLKGMLELLKKEGTQPLFRDCSFLGFPSVFIVVPGFSNMYPANMLFYRDMVSTGKAIRIFDHFPDLSEEEETSLLRLIRFKERSVMENTILFMACRQLSEEYSQERIASYLYLKRGEYSLAREYLRKLEARTTDKGEIIYLRALRQYARAVESGLSNEQAHTMIRKLYREDAAERVCQDTADPGSIMQKVFKKMDCYNCDHCALAGKECNYPATREILLKAALAMKAENADQNELLRILSEMYND